MEDTKSAPVDLSWHPVGRDDEPPDGTLRPACVAGREVCLGRVEGTWVAFEEICPHAECPLSEGDLAGTIVTCPCHGSEFDVLTGDVLSPPALDPLAIFEARVDGGVIQVRLQPASLAAAAAAERDGHISLAARTGTGPSTEGVALEDVDLTDLDVWEQRVPHEWFALLRREAPLHWHPERDGRGFWCFTRYDDVVAISKDFATYSSELGGTSMQDLAPDEVEARKSMLDTDPPAHTRLRALVNKGFTPKVVHAYEARVRELARGILAGALAQPELDWVAGVASEIPMWVFSEIMGLPLEDRRLLIDLGDKVLGNTDPEVMGGDQYVSGVSAAHPQYRLLPFSSPYAADLIDYGRRLGEARRRDPRDDITTKLVQAEVDGERLDDREFGVFFILLTTAGNETTRHTISLGLLSLLEHEEARRRLIADPSLCVTAADEILRWAHPVHYFRRTATRDHVVHGKRVQAGDKVVFWYASGNFDEEKFVDPYRFDVGRTPNRHLTFGLGGPHYCLGAHLARLEVRVWLEEMIPYLDRIELAGEPARLRSNLFNGIKRLPVRVRA
jgi:cytochrome P450/nitrite reductase/ring-hydroxylating ferredoxin subunit